MFPLLHSVVLLVSCAYLAAEDVTAWTKLNYHLKIAYNAMYSGMEPIVAFTVEDIRIATDHIGIMDYIFD